MAAARWRLVLAAVAGAGLLGGCTSAHLSPPAAGRQPAPTTTTTTEPPTTTTSAPATPSATLATSGSLTGSEVPVGVVDCTSAEVCVGVGGANGALTTDGGRRWASTAPFPGVAELDALACATPDSCLAVGWNLVGFIPRGVALTTADGGRTWSTVTAVPAGVGKLTSVSCPAVTSCMVVGSSTDGSRGVVFETDASASRWRSLSLPDGQLGASLVACTTALACVLEGADEAVTGDRGAGEDTGILTTTDGGATWTAPAFPPGWLEYKGLVCASTGRCLLVGDATPGDGNPSGVALASSDGGGTWTSATLPPETNILNAVACPTAMDCVAVGGGIEPRGGSVEDILTTSDGGQQWTSRPVPAAVVGLSSVSCPTASSCVAVGFGPSGAAPSGFQSVVAVTSDDGATWSVLG